MSRRDEVVDAAERVLESEGLDAITMRRLASELGIQAPSLYKHVRDKAEIEAALQERALIQLTDALGAAGPDITGLGRAYRAWALAHPGLYAISAQRPLHRDRLTPGVEAAAAAPLMAAVSGNLDRARALWGLAHGLVSLELAARFPPGADVDAAWAAGVDAFVRRRAAAPRARAATRNPTTS